MGKIKFNDISTDDLELIVQTPPTQSFPDRDVSSVHVPGRNGDLYIDNKCYKNVIREYSLAKAFPKDTDYPFNAQTILSWLNSAEGKYAKLIDSYDSEIYRMATFAMSGSFTNIWDKALTVKIQFQCKPQRYLIKGDIPITTESSTMWIENLYGYPSLPIITIDGLDAVINYDSDILMLGIFDDNDNAISNITITKVPGSQEMFSTLEIDSENQTVLDENQNDVNSAVGTNGNDFPSLKPGKNKIEIKKYDMDVYSNESTISGHHIPTYNYLISQHQTVVTSAYKPKTELIKMNQKKVHIRSYAALMSSLQEIYNAESPLSHIEKSAESYTFISFNDILSSTAQTWTISGLISEQASWPTWMQPNSDNTKVVVSERGYFLIKNQDKKLKLHTVGQDLLTNVGANSLITVYYYPAKSNSNELDVDYTDLPEWLATEIHYDSDDSPTQIDFKVNKVGYIWTDKTWLFGSAKWTQYVTTGAVLNSLKWNSNKLAFVSTSGLTTSTTATFTYKYSNGISQYEDIMAVSTNDAGETISTLIAKCRFTIAARDSSFSLFTLYAKFEYPDGETGPTRGLFAIARNGESNISDWALKNNNSQIADVNGNDSFALYYLEENQNTDDGFPDYSKEEDWPEWLSPNPIKTGSKAWQPSTIKFEVLESNFYRYSYDAEGNEWPDEWQELDTGDYVMYDSDHNKDYNSTFEIAQIESVPDLLDFDRMYLDIDGNPIEKPDWLQVKFYSDSTLQTELTAEQYRNLEDKSNVAIRYMTGEDVSDNGYFKWDLNQTWMYKAEADSDLLVSKNMDETIFYYMHEKPSYDAYDIFTATVSEDVNGNPNLITFKASVRGYFRPNNNSDWKDYKVGDELIRSKVGETNTIRYLVLDQDADLSNLKITVIPRWWML